MIKVLSFRLEGRLLGIETKFVKEINRNVEYTVIPRAPKSIVGLFNMRGQVVTLFNLANIFEYDEEDCSEKKTCIILKTQTNNLNQIGFLIDKTEDVFDLDEEMCETPPANSAEKEYKYVKKVAKLKNDLLLLIENEEIFGELAVTANKK